MEALMEDSPDAGRGLGGHRFEGRKKQEKEKWRVLHSLPAASILVAPKLFP